MTTPLHDQILYHVRDMFLFSCYTGIPYSDMRLLTNENLSLAKMVPGGSEVLAKKQGLISKFPLWNCRFISLKNIVIWPLRESFSPCIPTVSLNRYLKRIAEICHIERNLVFHAARHTYATEITLSHGVPLETVSKMLGHSRIETTQHYAKVTDNKIDTDTRALNKKIAERFSVVI